MKKSAYLKILFYLISAGILALSLRGNLGNPQAEDLFSLQWQGHGPFESSNDRGRFALTYSFVEDHSLRFSVPVANFAVPDLAVTAKGEYVSLFAPGVSFLVMPGYIVGKYFGASQAGTFAIVAVFALINAFLIYAIAGKLGARPVAAVLGALVFLFATPAFAYAVSLSQHHFSVFLLLLSVYSVIRWNNWWSLSIVWLACALSVVIDNPNIFFMFPVGLYALGKIVILKKGEKSLNIAIKPLYILTFFIMIFPFVFFGWFNQSSNGSPFKLSGTLQRALSIVDQNAQSAEIGTNESLVNFSISKKEKVEGAPREKTAIGFFDTRNILNGLYVHFTSADRGTIWYAPVVFLGLFGLIMLFRKHSRIAAMISASIAANILIYSMWGDPWGGWAFGSRYLIPAYALFCIGLGIALTQWRRNILFMLLFLALFVYSARINALGALGTSAIPPRVEVLALEELTGRVQKYNYERSRDYLYEAGSKALAYREYFNKYMTAYQYYNLISGLIIVFGASLAGYLLIAARREKL